MSLYDDNYGFGPFEDLDEAAYLKVEAIAAERGETHLLPPMPDHGALVVYHAAVRLFKLLLPAILISGISGILTHWMVHWVVPVSLIVFAYWLKDVIDDATRDWPITAFNKERLK